MNTLSRRMWPGAVALALVSGRRRQRPESTGEASGPAQAAPAQTAPEQVIRTGVELITTDAIVRDSRGQFIADLKKDEFEIYEDGVKQEIASMTMSHGGRVYNVSQPPPPPAPEGIILPPVRPINDTSGRIFLFFVDDLHLQFQNTGRVRELFKKISKELDPRRRHVRHRLERAVVDRDRHDLRPQAPRRGDQQDHGQRA